MQNNILPYADFRSELIIRLNKHFEGSERVERVELLLAGYVPEDEETAKDVKILNARNYDSDDDALVEDTIRFTIPMRDTLQQALRIPVKTLYDIYAYGQWQGVLAQVQQFVNTGTGISPDVIDHMDDYEFVKSRLTLQCRNAARACLSQMDYIHQRIEDFAVLLYVDLGNNGAGMNFQTAIPRSQFEKWGVSEREAIETAMKNTAANRPVLIGSTQEALEHDGTPRVFDLSSPEARQAAKAVVGGKRAFITSNNSNDSPILVFLPNVLEHISEIYGGDFYVVFISEDNTLIEPATTSQASIRAGLRNAKCRGHKPMLTDYFLYYDSAKKKFRIKN